MTVKAVFLLPLADNDGRALAAEIAAARDQVYDRFDGWTFEGNVTGAFRMAGGTKKIDTCQRYMVFLNDSCIGELEMLLREFKARTPQVAIYLEIQHDVDIRLI